MYDLRCNAGRARPVKVRNELSRHEAVNGAPRLGVHALNNLRTTEKHEVNRTKINRKRSPDTGIEPETSDMPGKRANRYTTRTST